MVSYGPITTIVVLLLLLIIGIDPNTIIWLIILINVLILIIEYFV